MSLFITLFNKFSGARYGYPLVTLFALLILACLLYLQLDRFRFDASEDSLVAQGDPALAVYREVSETFGGDDFLFLTYTPDSETVFAPASLARIADLEEQIDQVPGVADVTSLLDAPLLQNPPVPLSDIAGNIKTLGDENVDLELARQELTSSPLFKNLLVSEDGSVTALRITLASNNRLRELAEQRRTLNAEPGQSQQARQELATVESDYRQAYRKFRTARQQTLDRLEAIRDRVDGGAESYLGGVPLVAADMIDYVRQDLLLFGTLVMGIVAGMLAVLFRKLRWVLLPLCTTGTAIYFTVGTLGLLEQPVTVVSSNFISLLVIVCISFSIHLVRRYRELASAKPDIGGRQLALACLKDKFAPCLFMTITTVVAFGSLTTSEIIPVRDFGWIVCTSILISFLVTYSLFASLLFLLPKTADRSDGSSLSQTAVNWLGHGAEHHSGVTLLGALLLVLFAGLGISKLSMDNHFLDYFRADSQIHRSLSYIDSHLGGTTPIDIIMEFPAVEDSATGANDDIFAQPGESGTATRYWYTPDKIQQVERLHEFLNRQPGVGKTISIATFSRIAREFNDDKPLNAVQLASVLGAIPERFQSELLAPYADPDSGMMRVSGRLHESSDTLSYSGLIEDIRHFAEQEMSLSPDQIRITGMAVLFNNMLENLYASQRSTLLFVIGATLALLLVLLRSPTLAVIGLLPNILAAATVLGVMGLTGIPLDMMTITIAAIIIGIGIDDAIHYLHRFKQELKAGADVGTAVRRSHDSVGLAVYYTSITLITGFVVLVFSNFTPTVYFGALTALAMGLALLANLSLLPALLIRFYRLRPIETETVQSDG
ncbi:MAG: MMPL family transporter [Pseudomonadales bacterium]|nr:MMPL family transporter [Pseudomonadales bacterium]